MKNFKLMLAWLLVIGMMVLIYSFSAQVAEDSNKASKEVTEKIVVQVNKVADTKLTAASLNHYIRKSAHFFIYMALGFLLMNAMIRLKLSLEYSYVVAFLLSVLYAISDEVHQHFVPGRGPGIKDVIIDSMGALIGITIYVVLYRLTLKFKNKLSL